jgi:hypothetical protein
VASFVDWYNHQHRHSGIKFVTPHERHSGQAVGICRYRTGIYERQTAQCQAVVKIDQLLASNGGGLNQSAGG